MEATAAFLVTLRGSLSPLGPVPLIVSTRFAFTGSPQLMTTRAVAVSAAEEQDRAR